MKFLATSLAVLAGSASAARQSNPGHRTLFPAHPPGHDANHLDHLIPGLQQALHYREDGKTEHDVSSFGHILSTFNYPTVLLDHSSQVEKVACRPNGLDVCFTSDEAKSHAEEKWKANHGPLLLGTNHAGCGDYDTGMRAFWKVSSISFGSSKMKNRCAHVNATELPLEDAMDEFEMDFGHYEEALQQRDQRAAQRNSLRRRDAAIAEDDTVDITDDPDKLASFFEEPITETYPDAPEATPANYNGTVTPIDKRAMLQERGFWDWISNAVKTVTNAIVDAVETVVNVVKRVVEVVIDAGREIGKFIQDPLGYEWSLGTSVERSFNLGGSGTTRVPTSSGLFGEGSGLVIASSGIIPANISCENCYARGEVSFSGRVAASIRDGMKEGYLQAGAGWDSRLALAMTLQGQYKLEAFKKELLAYNPTPLQIPGFLSIGPQISVSAVIDIYFQAEADILIGAKFEITPGKARLDFLDGSKTGVTGFEPKFTPIAKFRGDPKLGVTLDFGLPLALEFGVDVLSGKWKKTVGLVDQPSFLVNAKAGEDESCKGITLGLAVQNYIYISLELLGLYDHAIDTQTLWEKPLGCVGEKTTSKDLKRRALEARDDGDEDEDIKDPKIAVDNKFSNGSISTKPPKIDHVPVDVDTVEPVTKFSYDNIITDVNRTAVLFAGKEDRLYLAPYGDPDTAAGSPFASRPDASDVVIIGDIYGGYLNYNPSEMEATGVSNLRSSRLTDVPVGSKFITLAEVHTSELEDSPAMYVGAIEDRFYALATCSVIDMGTRMYVVDAKRDGLKDLNNNDLADSIVAGDVRGCQYVYLTSNRKGLKLAE